MFGIESPLKWPALRGALDKECRESHKTQCPGLQDLGKPSLTHSLQFSSKYLPRTYYAPGRKRNKTLAPVELAF